MPNMILRARVGWCSAAWLRPVRVCDAFALRHSTLQCCALMCAALLCCLISGWGIGRVAHAQQQQPRTGSAAALIEQWPSTDKHRGIVRYGAYVIFPENRAGNALYVQNTMLFSASHQDTLTAAYPLTGEGNVAYVLRSPTNQLSLKVRLSSKNRLVQLKQLVANFYYVVMVLDRVVYKKILRVQARGVQDLLPRVKNASLPVVGEQGIAFYHIGTYSPKTESTPPLYGFRLHFAPFDNSTVLHSAQNFQFRFAALRMHWQTPTSLQIQSKNRAVQVIPLEQFQ